MLLRMPCYVTDMWHSVYFGTLMIFLHVCPSMTVDTHIQYSMRGPGCDRGATDFLNPFPANVTYYVTWATRAPLDAPHGPSETVPVLWDPCRW